MATTVARTTEQKLIQNLLGQVDELKAQLALQQPPASAASVTMVGPGVKRDNSFELPAVHVEAQFRLGLQLLIRPLQPTDYVSFCCLFSFAVT